MKRIRVFLRSVSIILLQSLILQQVSFADVITPSKINPLSKPGVSLEIPDTIATIEDTYSSAYRSQRTGDRKLTPDASTLNAGKLIYLLQDAHTNESAQYNLAKALDVILKKENNSQSTVHSPQQADRRGQSTMDHGLKYVFTEAGIGDNSLAFLRPFRPLAERTKLAKSYIKKGILHGAEYLDLTSEHNFTLWGVENPDLYIQSIQNYKAVAKERDRFDLYLKKIDSTLETLKNRLMNPALQTFSKESKLYHQDKLALTEYFQALLRESTIHNIDIKKYPHLTKLKDLKNKEEKLDFQKANEEHIKAVQSLPQDIQQELKEISQVKPGKILQNKKEERAYFQYLEEKLSQRIGISGQRSADRRQENLTPASSTLTPELNKYFEYLKLAKDIQAKEILSELKAFEQEVFSTLAKSEDEKSLIQSEQMLRYLNKLFHFTLTPDEYKEYKELTGNSSESGVRSSEKAQTQATGGAGGEASAARSAIGHEHGGVPQVTGPVAHFGIEHLTGFLNKKIMDLETYYERSLFLEKGYEEMVKRSEEFYELTYARDAYFLTTALEKMDKEGQTKAALITGGFHTTNLKEMLKKQNISFVSITPQVLQETNIKKYESILLNQVQTLKNPQPLTLKPGASTAMTLAVMTLAASGSRLGMNTVSDFEGAGVQRTAYSGQKTGSMAYVSTPNTGNGARLTATESPSGAKNLSPPIDGRGARLSKTSKRQQVDEGRRNILGLLAAQLLAGLMGLSVDLAGQISMDPSTNTGSRQELQAAIQALFDPSASARAWTNVLDIISKTPSLKSDLMMYLLSEKGAYERAGDATSARFFERKVNEILTAASDPIELLLAPVDNPILPIAHYEALRLLSGPYAATFIQDSNSKTSGKRKFSYISFVYDLIRPDLRSFALPLLKDFADSDPEVKSSIVDLLIEKSHQAETAGDESTKTVYDDALLQIADVDYLSRRLSNSHLSENIVLFKKIISLYGKPTMVFDPKKNVLSSLPDLLDEPGIAKIFLEALSTSDLNASLLDQRFVNALLFAKAAAFGSGDSDLVSRIDTILNKLASLAEGPEFFLDYLTYTRENSERYASKEIIHLLASSRSLGWGRVRIGEPAMDGSFNGMVSRDRIIRIVDMLLTTSEQAQEIQAILSKIRVTDAQILEHYQRIVGNFERNVEERRRLIREATSFIESINGQQASGESLQSWISTVNDPDLRALLDTHFSRILPDDRPDVDAQAPFWDLRINLSAEIIQAFTMGRIPIERLPQFIDVIALSGIDSIKDTVLAADFYQSDPLFFKKVINLLDDPQARSTASNLLSHLVAREEVALLHKKEILKAFILRGIPLESLKAPVNDDAIYMKVLLGMFVRPAEQGEILTSADIDKIRSEALRLLVLAGRDVSEELKNDTEIIDVLAREIANPAHTPLIVKMVVDLVSDDALKPAIVARIARANVGLLDNFETQDLINIARESYDTHASLIIYEYLLDRGVRPLNLEGAGIGDIVAEIETGFMADAAGRFLTQFSLDLETRKLAIIFLAYARDRALLRNDGPKAQVLHAFVTTLARPNDARSEISKLVSEELNPRIRRYLAQHLNARGARLGEGHLTVSRLQGARLATPQEYKVYRDLITASDPGSSKWRRDWAFRRLQRISGESPAALQKVKEDVVKEMPPRQPMLDVLNTLDGARLSGFDWRKNIAIVGILGLLATSYLLWQRDPLAPQQVAALSQSTRRIAVSEFISLQDSLRGQPISIHFKDGRTVKAIFMGLEGVPGSTSVGEVARLQLPELIAEINGRQMHYPLNQIDEVSVANTLASSGARLATKLEVSAQESGTTLSRWIIGSEKYASYLRKQAPGLQGVTGARLSHASSRSPWELFKTFFVMANGLYLTIEVLGLYPEFWIFQLVLAGGVAGWATVLLPTPTKDPTTPPSAVFIASSINYSIGFIGLMFQANKFIQHPVSLGAIIGASVLAASIFAWRERVKMVVTPEGTYDDDSGPLGNGDGARLAGVTDQSTVDSPQSIARNGRLSTVDRRPSTGAADGARLVTGSGVSVEESGVRKANLSASASTLTHDQVSGAPVSGAFGKADGARLSAKTSSKWYALAQLIILKEALLRGKDESNTMQEITQINQLIRNGGSHQAIVKLTHLITNSGSLNEVKIRDLQAILKFLNGEWSVDHPEFSEESEKSKLNRVRAINELRDLYSSLIKQGVTADNDWMTILQEATQRLIDEGSGSGAYVVETLAGIDLNGFGDGVIINQDSFQWTIMRIGVGLHGVDLLEWNTGSRREAEGSTVSIFHRRFTFSVDVEGPDGIINMGIFPRSFHIYLDQYGTDGRVIDKKFPKINPITFVSYNQSDSTVYVGLTTEGREKIGDVPPMRGNQHSWGDTYEWLKLVDVAYNPEVHGAKIFYQNGEPNLAAFADGPGARLAGIGRANKANVQNGMSFAERLSSASQTKTGKKNGPSVTGEFAVDDDDWKEYFLEQFGYLETQNQVSAVTSDGQTLALLKDNDWNRFAEDFFRALTKMFPLEKTFWYELRGDTFTMRPYRPGEKLATQDAPSSSALIMQDIKPGQMIAFMTLSGTGPVGPVEYVRSGINSMGIAMVWFKQENMPYAPNAIQLADIAGVASLPAKPSQAYKLLIDAKDAAEFSGLMGGIYVLTGELSSIQFSIWSREFQPAIGRLRELVSRINDLKKTRGIPAVIEKVEASILLLEATPSSDKTGARLAGDGKKSTVHSPQSTARSRLSTVDRGPLTGAADDARLADVSGVSVEDSGVSVPESQIRKLSADASTLFADPLPGVLGKTDGARLSEVVRDGAYDDLLEYDDMIRAVENFASVTPDLPLKEPRTLIFKGFGQEPMKEFSISPNADVNTYENHVKPYLTRTRAENEYRYREDVDSSGNKMTITTVGARLASQRSSAGKAHADYKTPRAERKEHLFRWIYSRPELRANGFTLSDLVKNDDLRIKSFGAAAKHDYLEYPGGKRAAIHKQLLQALYDDQTIELGYARDKGKAVYFFTDKGHHMYGSARADISDRQNLYADISDEASVSGARLAGIDESQSHTDTEPQVRSRVTGDVVILSPDVAASSGARLSFEIGEITKVNLKADQARFQIKIIPPQVSENVQLIDYPKQIGFDASRDLTVEQVKQQILDVMRRPDVKGQNYPVVIRAIYNHFDKNRNILTRASLNAGHSLGAISNGLSGAAPNKSSFWTRMRITDDGAEKSLWLIGALSGAIVGYSYDNPSVLNAVIGATSGFVAALFVEGTFDAEGIAYVQPLDKFEKSMVLFFGFLFGATASFFWFGDLYTTVIGGVAGMVLNFTGAALFTRRGNNNDTDTTGGARPAVGSGDIGNHFKTPVGRVEIGFHLLRGSQFAGRERDAISLVAPAVSAGHTIGIETEELGTIAALKNKYPNAVVLYIATKKFDLAAQAVNNGADAVLMPNFIAKIQSLRHERPDAYTIVELSTKESGVTAESIQREIDSLVPLDIQGILLKPYQSRSGYGWEQIIPPDILRTVAERNPNLTIAIAGGVTNENLDEILSLPSNVMAFASLFGAETAEDVQLKVDQIRAASRGARLTWERAITRRTALGAVGAILLKPIKALSQAQPLVAQPSIRVSEAQAEGQFFVIRASFNFPQTMSPDQVIEIEITGAEDLVETVSSIGMTTQGLAYDSPGISARSTGLGLIQNVSSVIRKNGKTYVYVVAGERANYFYPQRIQFNFPLDSQGKVKIVDTRYVDRKEMVPPTPKVVADAGGARLSQAGIYQAMFLLNEMYKADLAGADYGRLSFFDKDNMNIQRDRDEIEINRNTPEDRWVITWLHNGHMVYGLKWKKTGEVFYAMRHDPSEAPQWLPVRMEDSEEAMTFEEDPIAFFMPVKDGVAFSNRSNIAIYLDPDLFNRLLPWHLPPAREPNTRLGLSIRSIPQGSRLALDETALGEINRLLDELEAAVYKYTVDVPEESASRRELTNAIKQEHYVLDGIRSGNKLVVFANLGKVAFYVLRAADVESPDLVSKIIADSAQGSPEYAKLIDQYETMMGLKKGQGKAFVLFTREFIRDVLKIQAKIADVDASVEKSPKAADLIPIDRLELTSFRATYLTHHNLGVEFANDLTHLTERHILSFHNVGRETLLEIDRALAAVGLSLRPRKGSKYEIERLRTGIQAKAYLLVNGILTMADLEAQIRNTEPRFMKIPAEIRGSIISAHEAWKKNAIRGARLTSQESHAEPPVEMGHVVLDRNVGQTIKFGNDVVIKVERRLSSRVVLEITAPKSMPINRHKNFGTEGRSETTKSNESGTILWDMTKDEKVFIGDDIVLLIVEIGRTQVRIRSTAPKNMLILRGELEAKPIVGAAGARLAATKSPSEGARGEREAEILSPLTSNLLPSGKARGARLATLRETKGQSTASVEIVGDKSPRNLLIEVLFDHTNNGIVHIYETTSANDAISQKGPLIRSIPIIRVMGQSVQASADLVARVLIAEGPIDLKMLREAEQIFPLDKAIRAVIEAPTSFIIGPVVKEKISPVGAGLSRFYFSVISVEKQQPYIYLPKQLGFDAAPSLSAKEVEDRVWKVIMNNYAAKYEDVIRAIYEELGVYYSLASQDMTPKREESDRSPVRRKPRIRELIELASAAGYIDREAATRITGILNGPLEMHDEGTDAVVVLRVAERELADELRAYLAKRGNPGADVYPISIMSPSDVYAVIRALYFTSSRPSLHGSNGARLSVDLESILGSKLFDKITQFDKLRVSTDPADLIKAQELRRELNLGLSKRIDELQAAVRIRSGLNPADGAADVRNSIDLVRSTMISIRQEIKIGHPEKEFLWMKAGNGIKALNQILAADNFIRMGDAFVYKRDATVYVWDKDKEVDLVTYVQAFNQARELPLTAGFFVGEQGFFMSGYPDYVKSLDGYTEVTEVADLSKWVTIDTQGARLSSPDMIGINRIVSKEMSDFTRWTLYLTKPANLIEFEFNKFPDFITVDTPKNMTEYRVRLKAEAIMRFYRGANYTKAIDAIFIRFIALRRKADSDRRANFLRTSSSTTNVIGLNWPIGDLLSLVKNRGYVTDGRIETIRDTLRADSPSSDESGDYAVVIRGAELELANALRHFILLNGIKDLDGFETRDMNALQLFWFIEERIKGVGTDHKSLNRYRENRTAVNITYRVMIDSRTTETAKGYFIGDADPASQHISIRTTPNKDPLGHDLDMSRSLLLSVVVPAGARLAGDGKKSTVHSPQSIARNGRLSTVDRGPSTGAADGARLATGSGVSVEESGVRAVLSAEPSTQTRDHRGAARGARLASRQERSREDIEAAIQQHLSTMSGREAVASAAYMLLSIYGIALIVGAVTKLDLFYQHPVLFFIATGILLVPALYLLISNNKPSPDISLEFSAAERSIIGMNAEFLLNRFKSRDPKLDAFITDARKDEKKKAHDLFDEIWIAKTNKNNAMIERLTYLYTEYHDHDGRSPYDGVSREALKALRVLDREAALTYLQSKLAELKVSPKEHSRLQISRMFRYLIMDAPKPEAYAEEIRILFEESMIGIADADLPLTNLAVRVLGKSVSPTIKNRLGQPISQQDAAALLGLLSEIGETEYVSTYVQQKIAKAQSELNDIQARLIPLYQRIDEGEQTTREEIKWESRHGEPGLTEYRDSVTTPLGEEIDRLESRRSELVAEMANLRKMLNGSRLAGTAGVSVEEPGIRKSFLSAGASTLTPDHGGEATSSGARLSAHFRHTVHSGRVEDVLAGSLPSLDQEFIAKYNINTIVIKVGAQTTTISLANKSAEALAKEIIDLNPVMTLLKETPLVTFLFILSLEEETSGGAQYKINFTVGSVEAQVLAIVRQQLDILSDAEPLAVDALYYDLWATRDDLLEIIMEVEKEFAINFSAEEKDRLTQLEQQFEISIEKATLTRWRTVDNIVTTVAGKIKEKAAQSSSGAGARLSEETSGQEADDLKMFEYEQLSQAIDDAVQAILNQPDYGEKTVDGRNYHDAHAIIIWVNEKKGDGSIGGSLWGDIYGDGNKRIAGLKRLIGVYAEHTDSEGATIGKKIADTIASYPISYVYSVRHVKWDDRYAVFITKYAKTADGARLAGNELAASSQQPAAKPNLSLLQAASWKLLAASRELRPSKLTVSGLFGRGARLSGARFSTTKSDKWRDAVGFLEAAMSDLEVIDKQRSFFERQRFFTQGPVGLASLEAILEREQMRRSLVVAVGILQPEQQRLVDVVHNILSLLKVSSADIKREEVPSDRHLNVLGQTLGVFIDDIQDVDPSSVRLQDAGISNSAIRNFTEAKTLIDRISGARLAGIDESQSHTDTESQVRSRVTDDVVTLSPDVAASSGARLSSIDYGLLSEPRSSRLTASSLFGRTAEPLVTGALAPGVLGEADGARLTAGTGVSVEESGFREDPLSADASALTPGQVTGDLVTGGFGNVDGARHSSLVSSLRSDHREFRGARLSPAVYFGLNLPAASEFNLPNVQEGPAEVSPSSLLAFLRGAISPVRVAFAQEVGQITILFSASDLRRYGVVLNGDTALVKRTLPDGTVETTPISLRNVVRDDHAGQILEATVSVADGLMLKNAKREAVRSALGVLLTQSMDAGVAFDVHESIVRGQFDSFALELYALHQSAAGKMAVMTSSVELKEEIYSRLIGLERSLRLRTSSLTSLYRANAPSDYKNLVVAVAGEMDATAGSTTLWIQKPNPGSVSEFHLELGLVEARVVTEADTIPIEYLSAVAIALGIDLKDLVAATLKQVQLGFVDEFLVINRFAYPPMTLKPGQEIQFLKMMLQQYAQAA